jgi:hypothetical protein
MLASFSKAYYFVNGQKWNIRDKIYVELNPQYPDYSS